MQTKWVSAGYGKNMKKTTVVRFGNIMACFTQNAHHLNIYRLFKHGTKHLMA